MALLVLGLLVTSQACFAGGLPPSRSDVASTMVKPDGEAKSGLRFSTGAHWASGSDDKNEDYDLGFGYVYENVEQAAGDITSKASMDDDAGKSVSHGMYLSAERVLYRDKKNHQRTWLGMRTEYLRPRRDDQSSTLTVVGRINWEVFGHVEGSGVSSTNCGSVVGFAYGTMGLGFYAEAGARRNTDGSGGSVIGTLGLSMRLPLLGGFGFDLCPD